MIILSSILFIATELLAQTSPNAPRRRPAPSDLKCFITFTGEASGGTMMLCQSSRGMERCISVDTMPGEPAEQVISRLADAIEETNPFGWLIVRNSKGPNRRSVTASGGTLILPGFCGYTIAGTEIGLGIPQPPHSLTCNFHPDTNTISIRWINPSPDEYDSIVIGFNRVIQGAHLSGKVESYDVNLIYEQSRNNDNDNDNELHKMLSQMGSPSYSLSDITADLNIRVIGTRNGIHSNVVAIHLKNNIQEELCVIPFTSNIAPNWQPWVLDNNEGKIHFEQGVRKEYAKITELSDPVNAPETKPFYQIIKTGDKGGTGGVFRKFIGLTPGHTYRIKTRVAVLSEPNEKNWSVSVHAAPNAANKRNFTARQMADFDALPVPGAAIKLAADHTKGRFAEISTGHSIDGQEIKDITLPAGTDSIMIWVKCVGPSGLSAAIDWISLEDLSSKKL
jgi:hypothetical protein